MNNTTILKRRLGTVSSVLAAVFQAIDILVTVLLTVFLIVLLSVGSYSTEGINLFLYYMLFLVIPTISGLLNPISSLILLLGGRDRNYHIIWHASALLIEAVFLVCVFLFYFGTYGPFVILSVKLIFAVYTVFQMERTAKSAKAEKKRTADSQAPAGI